MKFESVIELKHTLIAQTLRRAAGARAAAEFAIRSRAVSARSLAGDALSPRLAGLSLGIARASNKKDWVLAVRVQEKRMLGSALIEEISRTARNEVNIRYTGAVRQLAGHSGRWYRQRRRPLEIGISIGHKNISAGTLGAFVRLPGRNEWFILSNNHVLADVNLAAIGDEILQPGPADGGGFPEDVVARLEKFVKLSFSQVNYVDCAIAAVESAIEVIPDFVHGLGKIGPMREEDAELLMAVSKLGRTTGLTRGRITAVALDGTRVDMGMGIAEFDNQIEIESADKDLPFSLGGDSGSVIFDGDVSPTALLFAGSESGGAGDQGLTFANPIKAVVDALGISFPISK